MSALIPYVIRERCATKINVRVSSLRPPCKMCDNSNAWKAEIRMSENVCVRRVRGQWFLQKVCTRRLYSFKLAPEGESVAKAQNL